nr:MAG TPA: hypothetical protein [Caudoviricetes sp.]
MTCRISIPIAAIPTPMKFKYRVVSLSFMLRIIPAKTSMMIRVSSLSFIECPFLVRNYYCTPIAAGQLRCVALPHIIEHRRCNNAQNLQFDRQDLYH